MIAVKVVVAILALTLLGACGSTPQSHYYVLDADSQLPLAAAENTATIGLRPILIPEYLDRREIITNRNHHQLALADFDRWAEPIDTGIQRVVAMNLATLLNSRNIQIFPWGREARPEYDIEIRIIRLDVREARAGLAAQWKIVRHTHEKETIAQRFSRLEIAAPSNLPGDVAAAYSALLSTLSKDIAGEVENKK